MIVLFLSFLGVLLSLVILRFNPKNKFLAAFYFLTCINGTFPVAIYYFKIPLFSVILLVHIFPLFFLIGPCIFFYYRGEITKSIALRKSDLLHLLPFVISILLILPYVFQSIEYKYQYITYFNASNFEAMNRMSVLKMPLRSFLVAKNFHQLGYLVYIGFWYYQVSQKDSFVLHKSKKQWLNFLTITLLISNVLIVLLTFFTLSDMNQSRTVSPYPTLILSSVLGTVIYISIFFFPNVLYEEVKKQAEPRLLLQPEGEQIQDFEKALESYLHTQPYLFADFGKPKMISDLKISDRFFTYYFNEYLGSSFAQWKSDLRIDYANNLVQNGYLKNHTIESLALLVGFQSRSKFSTAFKSRIGSLPSNASK